MPMRSQLTTMSENDAAASSETSYGHVVEVQGAAEHESDDARGGRLLVAPDASPRRTVSRRSLLIGVDEPTPNGGRGHVLTG